jgi:sugar/nucleoside kinase (ribokinase family)
LAGLGSFGGKGFFFGKVGADDHGRHYREDLEKIGVKTHLVESRDDATGTCLALITPDAERTMLTHLGIATSLSEADILAEPIRDSKILYIEGYLWDSPSARMASMKAMDIAKAAGKKVSFTFSDSFCVERHLQDFLSLAQDRVDILFCNEFEAVKATHSSDPREAFKIMKDWADIVCVTLGPQGALLSHRSEGLQEDLATWDVKLVDKLGAGDLFASGVLFGLTHSKSLKECGYLGSYAATRVIQQMGARLKSSLADEISKAVTGPSSPESTRRMTA